MCVTHRKRVKLETQNFCLGNIIGLERWPSVLLYWCTAYNRNLQLFFLCQYWCTSVLPAIETYNCFFVVWNTTAELTDNLLSPPSQAQWQRAYRTFTRTPGETLNTPPRDLSGAYFSCLLAYVFLALHGSA